VKLNSEDELRINVLLANARAVRLDESHGTVYGLGNDGELQFQLSSGGATPACVQAVRAYLSTQVLGSPRHFPTHLRRWSGLGQISNAPLDKLLMLGDPEAVFAVACSPRLSVDLAELAWWSLPEPAIARALLANQDVVRAPLGSTLAAWLFEYLPFEESAEHLFESVSLLLRPGVLDPDAQRKLWDKGRRNRIYRAAYLATCPDKVPAPAVTRALTAEQAQSLETLATRGIRSAALLLRAFSPDVQAFLAAADDVLTHATHPLEVTATFQAMEKTLACFAGVEPGGHLDGWRTELEALRTLGCVRESQLTTVLARSDAIGTVMRAQLKPIVEPLLISLKTIGGK
jgi:hypothetical protein